MKTLNKKLIYTFIIFSVGIIILTNVVLRIILNNNFNRYIRDNIDSRINEIYKNIERTYNNHGFSKEIIEGIGLEALDNGFILKVYNEKNESVWDATNHDMSKCTDMLITMERNMKLINQGSPGDYVESKIPLLIGGEAKGTIFLGYYGPIYYTSSEMMLFKSLNNALIVILVISIAISVIIGIILSKKISNPILDVRDKAFNIAGGNDNKSIKYNGDILEINSMVSSINKMGELLNEQKAFREELIRNVSHELRTPITTVSGQLEGILDGIFIPTNERIQSIFDEIQRLNRLLGSLDKLNTFDEGVKVTKSLGNLDSTIENTILSLEKDFLLKNIKIQYDLKCGEFLYDEDKIIQALLNILVNGIKYSEENSVINIRSFKTNGDVVIEIRDNGIGIPKKDLNNIFKRFYRVDDSRTRKTGGSGLGLSITKEIILSHNGDVTVESEINKGSTFKIFLRE
ncbi:MAG: sensor histidine kinase [Clostridium sp.]